MPRNRSLARLRGAVIRRLRGGVICRLRGGVNCRLRGGAADAGMATAEYAIATLAACGFAALLLTILRSAEVRALLFGIIRRALAVG